MGQTLIIFGLLAAVVVALLRLAWSSWKYAGPRVVTCPESQQPAGVALDTSHLAWSGIGRRSGFRLKSCSRWPERQDCGQECLRQIESAPDDCLMRNILLHWCEGKVCAICGRPLSDIHRVDHKPALMNPEQKTVEWASVRPETAPAVLETAAPVCWNCHIVQTFCREHPDLVVDRSRQA
jgi:hypothetical protein